MKEINHSTEANLLGGESIDHYMKTVRILIKEPYITGKAVAEILSVPPGSIGKIMQAARKTLGITLNGDFVDLSEKFAEQTVRLGFPAPTHTRYSRKYGAPAPTLFPTTVVIQGAEPLREKQETLNLSLKKIHKELITIMKREGISSIDVTEFSLKITRTKTITETFHL
jgi:hypothetical protein